MSRIAELPRVPISEVATEYWDISPVQRGQPYGRAHAFMALVENAQVIGSGSLIVNGKLVVHGLSTGNYKANIDQQLARYAEHIPNGWRVEEPCALVWGHPNFGHWVITYLMRMVLLGVGPGMPLLISNEVPKKYMDWLRLMGHEQFIVAEDGVTVDRLWVPSVLCYRGHYEDMNAYIYPPAVDFLRRLAPPMGGKRRRIYLSRDRAQWRKLENEADLMLLLKEYGVDRVFMEEMSAEEQLALVGSAELIVVHCGGSSPITLFAPQDCRILEISLPKIAGTFGSRCWADVIGQRFVRIDARPTHKTGPQPTDWDGIVPPGEVRRCLETLLAS